MTGRVNLTRYFELADQQDLDEARLAYPRYRDMMQRLADRYGHPLDRVCAAFVSLSPNSDYCGNLRSLISVLEGHRQKIPLACVTISTYNHCKRRAHAYLLGHADFVASTRGLKIMSFYHNIMDPQDPNWVTVDGHVVGAWRGNDSMTMKEALLKPRDYRIIRDDVMAAADQAGLIPCQYQAAIWFARKRHLGIRYSSQYDLFSDKSGITWDQIQPYAFLPAGQLSLRI